MACAFDKELKGKSGLPRARAALDKVKETSGQAAVQDVIQAVNAGGQTSILLHLRFSSLGTFGAPELSRMRFCGRNLA